MPLGSHGNAAGYIDMDKVIDAHPLHVQLDQLQAQITLLNGQAQNAPVPQTDAQRQAQAQMEEQLAAADQIFQAQMMQRRAYYGQREAAAIAALQAQTSGQATPIGTQLNDWGRKDPERMRAFVQAVREADAAGAGA